MREKLISKKIYYSINHCSRKSLLWLTSQLNSPTNKFVAWKWWGLLTMKQFPSKLYVWSSSKSVTYFLPVYVPHNSFISSALPTPPNVNDLHGMCTPWTALKEQLRQSKYVVPLVLQHYKPLATTSAKQNYLISRNKKKHCIYPLKQLKKWGRRSFHRSACAVGCLITDAICLGSNLKGITSILEDLPQLKKKIN